MPQRWLQHFAPARLLKGALRSRLPWVGFLAGVLGVCIGLTQSWRAIELKLFDKLVVATAPNSADLPVTIIGIDEESLAQIQKQWPWPRSLHAQILDRLREAGAAVVAFDVVFSEPSQPAEDAAFAEAIHRFGSVVLAADRYYVENQSTRQWKRVEPWAGFVEAGATPGFASVELDASDMVMRQIPSNDDAFWRRTLDVLEKRFPGVAAELQATSDMRIRYLGGPQTFTYIPYYKLLDPDRQLGPQWRDFLRDNVVFVGRNLKASADLDMAQSDMFQTPFFPVSRQLMPGVEIHANILANMKDGNAIHEASQRWHIVLLVAVMLLSLLSMRRWRPLLSGLYSLAMMGILGGLAYGLLAQRGIWLPVVGAMLTITLIYATQGGAAYVISQRKRREIKQAFSKYLSPAVVAEVLANPDSLKLGGERRELTFLFTDLAGFTSIAEQLEPGEVVTILNRHLSEMTEIVFRTKGTLDKFIGDAVMAFWGAPIRDEGQSVRAVETAIEMQAKMAVMRDEVSRAGGPYLHMRIGIHRGDCIVGNMGGEERFDYTVIGDAVNLAARIEGVNKIYGTGILCSESVAKAVAGRVSLRRVDVVRVKGKLQGVALFTPCSDTRLVAASDAAFAVYQKGVAHFEEAERLWQAVLAIAPNDTIAEYFLMRLAAFRIHGWPEEWDGVTTLDSK